MNILLVTTRYPWPPRRGDQLRAVQFLELLASQHQVTLLTPAPATGPADSWPKEGSTLPPGVSVETYRGRIRGRLLGPAHALLRGLPFQNALFYHPDLDSKLRRLAPAMDVVVLQLVRLAGYLPALGTVPLVVDLIDSLSLNLRLRSRFDRWWLSPLWRAEARRLAVWEERMLEASARGLVVSERDRLDLEARLAAPAARRLRVVPLAMPQAHPYPAVHHGRQTEPHAEGEPSRRDEGRPVLVMTGNLGYFPNRDAVRWWLARVWPALRLRRPDLTLTVAGDRPSRRLARDLDEAGVELVEAPSDLLSILRRATLALAPLRCGSGVPVKVLEAWSVGTPVVTSPWAALGVTGEPGRDLAVAEEPDEWVRTILELIDDPEARQRFADAGRRRLETDYAAAVVSTRLLDAVESAARKDEE